jgi:hypothetical protein
MKDYWLTGAIAFVILKTAFVVGIVLVLLWK